MKSIAVLSVAVLAAFSGAQAKTRLNASFSDLVAGQARPKVNVAPRDTSVGAALQREAPQGLPAPNGKAVPEPATLATLGIGIAALVRRRRKN